MSEQTNVFALDTSRPGVKRDGTALDNQFYSSAQWVRFQRGRPRKMGGYTLMSSLLAGPARNVYVDSTTLVNTAHVFSQRGIEQLQFDSNGNGGAIYNRNPTGFVLNANYTWQSDAMFDAAGGANTQLVCCSTPDLDNIASDLAGKIYSGPIGTTAALTDVSDGSPIQVSGGIVVLQPYLFVYGSQGLIRNSNANDFSAATGWSSGDANSANVAGTKIVKGLPVRGGGQAPAGLFWSLDSLIRVNYIGGTALWKYDPVSTNTTVMSKAGILEYDGIYFWVGVDRFYSYNGVVQELPNDMNSNFFFDNLNYAQRQKVHALKVPRFGEIWWFYPSGSNTECNRAIIFNVKENTWYDTEIVRSAGASARVFRLPVIAGESRAVQILKFTVSTGVFQATDRITGGTSGATGEVLKNVGGELTLQNTVGVFVNGETITGNFSGATGVVVGTNTAGALTSLWQHEKGVDRVENASQTAILASVRTSNFQWMTGGPAQDSPVGMNLQTRVARVEPDFILSGEMKMRVYAKDFAQGSEVISEDFAFDNTTPFIDPRFQGREVEIEFESNVLGGDFQMGKCLMTTEPGDSRG